MKVSLGKPFSILVLIAIGVLIWVALPPPQGIQSSEWAFLILFVLTIVGVLWSPYPIGVVVFISLALGLMLGTLTLAQALRGYSNSVTWIIVTAFLFARAFVKTGLGRRIALTFIKEFGRSSLQLGYSLALTDLVLAPLTASNTARTGGIVFPVARSLAQEFGSEPGPTASRIGSYLLFTAFQANIITSALFLTAMAANGLSVQFAEDIIGVRISWGLWFSAASVPGLVSFLILPYLIYLVYPPELTRTPEARGYAKKELSVLGPMKRSEKILSCVFLILAVTWATSTFHSISTIAAALAAIAVLLVSDVLTYDEVSEERSAWGTFIWFGGFVSLAGVLGDTGLINWFIKATGQWLEGWNGMAALLFLLLIYIYIHYGFASMTAQIIALYGAFLAIAVAAGAPKLLAALLFCFFSNLYASTTHYGDGAAPIYYGSGYIEQRPWWRVGFIISLFNIVIWLGIGLPWWKLLGIW